MASEVGTAVVFRAATLEDAPAILRLLEAAFGRWPDFEIDVPALEHLRWKMQPPDGLRAGHTVGVIEGTQDGTEDGGGEVVAVELRWLSVAQLGERNVVTNDGMDQAVDPRFQGRGLSRQLNEAESAQQQIGDLGIDTPTRNERLLNSRQRAANDRAERQLRTWVRDFDRRGQLGTRWRKGGPLEALRGLPSVIARRRDEAPAVAASAVAADPDATDGPAPNATAGPALDTTAGPALDTTAVGGRYTTEELPRFDERADRLWEAAREEFDIARMRGASYLNWRYDWRAGPSTVIGVSAGSELVGYAVLKPAGEAVQLVDVLVHPAHHAAAAPLLHRAAEVARGQGGRRIVAWLPSGHPIEDALATAGYLDSGRAVPIEFDTPPGSMSAVDLDRLRVEGLRMHITMGDFDFV